MHKSVALGQAGMVRTHQPLFKFTMLDSLLSISPSHAAQEAARHIGPSASSSFEHVNAATSRRLGER
jgi:hypothetical protein